MRAIRAPWTRREPRFPICWLKLTLDEGREDEEEAGRREGNS